MMIFRRLSRKTKIIAMALIGFFIIRFVFFRAPSESQLIARFHQHKIDFDRLSTILEKDKQVRYISSKRFSNKDWKNSNAQPTKISSEQPAQYHALIQKLGLTRVIRINSKYDYYRFEVFGGGFTDTSWGIGYAWSDDALEPLVKSAYQMPERGQHFAHIEGKWYIYHRH